MREREQVHEKRFCFGFSGLCPRACVCVFVGTCKVELRLLMDNGSVSVFSLFSVLLLSGRVLLYTGKCCAERVMIM